MNHGELLKGRVFETQLTLPAARGGPTATLPVGGRQLRTFRLNQVAAGSTGTGSWRHRHPALLGALIGAGAGLAFGGVLVASGQNNEPGLSNVAFSAGFIPLGAGIGALVGYAFR